MYFNLYGCKVYILLINSNKFKFKFKYCFYRSSTIFFLFSKYSWWTFCSSRSPFVFVWLFVIRLHRHRADPVAKPARQFGHAMQITNCYHYSFLYKLIVFMVNEHGNICIAWPNCRAGFATGPIIAHRIGLLFVRQLVTWKFQFL
jgi:hypothetical protein